MALKISISGFRGTIGGIQGDNLTPPDIVKYVTAYALYIKEQTPNRTNRVVIGRDARISGEMVSNLVCGTLQSMGFDVIDLQLSTTPTVELAVIYHKASGGIIITASHNPAEWNALKLLDSNGEFLNQTAASKVIKLAKSKKHTYNTIEAIGKYKIDSKAIQRHIESILKLKLVNVEAITNAKFRIVVDAVNSTGGIAIPAILKALGVVDIIELNCQANGKFAHNPEPLAQHLTEISKAVVDNKAHLGIVVDPDVDRLAFVNENGSMFGEEYTLVAVADYILTHTPGNTVSNLSSTRALRDITLLSGNKYQAAAVGEVNVVKKMKETNAIIGGEGNGGIIYPELHYGRDALVGVALFLSHLAIQQVSMSKLRSSYPAYEMEKEKIDHLPENINVKGLLNAIAEKYNSFPINKIDGVKIDFPDGWVHLRESNTEKIIRIYSESTSSEKAKKLALQIKKDAISLINL